ncbi:MAG: glycosyl hydrolase family 28-related protein [Ferruginibacter sp.]
MKYKGCYFLSFFLAIISFQSRSQIIPASRSTDWTLAGYNGIIPVYTLIRNITDYGGSGNGITPNGTALQNAIASLSNQNGVIYFPAGTFFFNTPVTLRSELVLRGAGASSTILQFDLAASKSLINVTGSTSAVEANVISSVLKGQTTLTVDNPSMVRVNDYIKLYQDNAGLITDGFAAESLGQIIYIESISGNTITFSHALRRNYLLADAPKIRRFTMVTGVGAECLKIKGWMKQRR